MGPTTDSADRLDVWRDLIREHFVALDIATDREIAFAGTVQSAAVGHLKVATVDSRTQYCQRTRGLARRDSDVYLQVGLVTRGEAVLCQDGREALIGPGDFALYETDRPFTWGLRGDWQLLVFTWPRTSVALDPGASRQRTARTVDGGDGLGRIVGRMLRDLVVSTPVLTPVGGVRLADEVAELVTTVAAEQRAPEPPAPAAADRLGRITAYIAEHLGDLDLSPRAVADAHFMSTRQLHRLFAAHGQTVAQYIRRERLERCRRMLADARPTAPTITEISRRWGFPDLASFSRAFRGTFRTTPTAYRAQYSTGA
jgi:AraC-like DNA-binding protein